jgi:RNA polymerase sigma-70 factor (ECF subfamily)
MGNAATADVAFEEFFRSNYARAFGIAVRMLGNAAEAEDAAAEAFSRALVRWRRVGTLDYRDAWVLRVTANVAIDVLRRRRGLPEGQATVQDAHADTVERLSLMRELESLPERQRDVLLLRYFGDLTDDDIARCLTMAHGTVKSHVHRGLSRLRRRFGVDGSVGDRADGKEVRVALDLHH